VDIRNSHDFPTLINVLLVYSLGTLKEGIAKVKVEFSDNGERSIEDAFIKNLQPCECPAFDIAELNPLSADLLLGLLTLSGMLVR
jgi:hypothetical protein